MNLAEILAFVKLKKAMIQKFDKKISVYGKKPSFEGFKISKFYFSRCVGYTLNTSKFSLFVSSVTSY